MRNYFKEAITYDDHIQKQVGADQNYCYADCFLEATEEDSSQRSNQDQRYSHLMFEQLGCERVFYDVSSGISRRERDSDNKIRGHETQQHQHKELALPTRQ